MTKGIRKINYTMSSVAFGCLVTAVLLDVWSGSEQQKKTVVTSPVFSAITWKDEGKTRHIWANSVVDKYGNMLRCLSIKFHQAAIAQFVTTRIIDQGAVRSSHCSAIHSSRYYAKVIVANVVRVPHINNRQCGMGRGSVVCEECCVEYICPKQGDANWPPWFNRNYVENSDYVNTKEELFWYHSRLLSFLLTKIGRSFLSKTLR